MTRILNFATVIVILSSLLAIAVQGSMQHAYAIAKINTVNVTPRAIQVTLPGGQKVTVFHLFVAYTQKADKAYVFKGFPFDPATGQIPKDSDLPLNLPSPYLLQGRCIPFESDNGDWPFRESPSTTVVSGADAKDVYKCFVKVTKTFNDAKIPYALLATNSNSYARAILDKCNVPGGDSRLPGVLAQLAPGWSITGLV